MRRSEGGRERYRTLGRVLRDGEDCGCELPLLLPSLQRRALTLPTRSDGVSLSCANSYVAHNTIHDATGTSTRPVPEQLIIVG